MYGAFWDSAEKRASLKAARAQRKASSGNRKAAQRLKRRSAILKVKAKGGPTLSPRDDYASLWAESYPYANRQRQSGSGLLGAAKGYRPVGAQIRSEQRAVILGGLAALKAAGIEPYTSLDTESLPQKMIQSDEQDERLIAAVRQATGRKFNGSLRRASEAVRAQVKQHGLESVAWPARALFMLTASSKRSSLTSASASAVSTGTAAAAAAVAGSGAAPPWVQNIVTAPAAGILGLVSLAASGVGAGAATKDVMAKSAAKVYEQAVTNNLDQWATTQQTQAVKAQLQGLRQVTSLQARPDQQQAEAQAEQAVKIVKVVAWTGGAAVGAGLLYYLLRNRSSS